MAIELRHGTKVWHRRERGAQFATWAAWLAGAAIFIYCWELISDKTIWTFVADAPTQAVDLAVRMVPPDWGFIHALWRPMWDTINIATLGTAMGTILAVPVAYCAARNTTPSAVFIRPAAMFIIVSSRSINSLIWALMLVTIIGPGVFAGISVFRWDINIRESTVLGLVGAGGIGLPLNAAITTLAWTQVSLILLIIIVTVVVSEWVSAKMRHAII